MLFLSFPFQGRMDIWSVLLMEALRPRIPCVWTYTNACFPSGRSMTELRLVLWKHLSMSKWLLKKTSWKVGSLSCSKTNAAYTLYSRLREIKRQKLSASHSRPYGILRRFYMKGLPYFVEDMIQNKFAVLLSWRSFTVVLFNMNFLSEYSSENVVVLYS